MKSKAKEYYENIDPYSLDNKHKVAKTMNQKTLEDVEEIFDKEMSALKDLKRMYSGNMYNHDDLIKLINNYKSQLKSLKI